MKLGDRLRTATGRVRSELEFALVLPEAIGALLAEPDDTERAARHFAHEIGGRATASSDKNDRMNEAFRRKFVNNGKDKS